MWGHERALARVSERSLAHSLAGVLPGRATLQCCMRTSIARARVTSLRRARVAFAPPPCLAPGHVTAVAWAHPPNRPNIAVCAVIHVFPNRVNTFLGRERRQVRRKPKLTGQSTQMDSLLGQISNKLSVSKAREPQPVLSAHGAKQVSRTRAWCDLSPLAAPLALSSLVCASTGYFLRNTSRLTQPGAVVFQERRRRRAAAHSAACEHANRRLRGRRGAVPRRWYRGGRSSYGDSAC